jgi:hypothetical protein
MHLRSLTLFVALVTCSLTAISEEIPIWDDPNRTIKIALDAVLTKHPEYARTTLEAVAPPKLFCDGVSPFTGSKDCFVSVSIFVKDGSKIVISKDRNDACVQEIEHESGFIVDLNNIGESIVGKGHGTFYKPCEEQSSDGA